MVPERACAEAMSPEPKRCLGCFWSSIVSCNMVYRVFLHVSPSNILVGPWVGKAVVVELITGGVEDFCKEPCATGRFGCAGGGCGAVGF